MIFYYVRHGDPIYEPDSLTELGYKQAAALAKRFSLYGLDEIYASTSIRAQQTAEPTCAALNKGKTLLDWTNEGHAWWEFTIEKEGGRREWIFGDSGYRQLLNSPEVLALGSKWYEHPSFASHPFKKGMERISKETDELLLSLGFAHDREKGYYRVVKPSDKERRVALFAHAGFGMAFLSSLLDIPYPYLMARMDLSHSSVTVVHFDESLDVIYPRVLQWANDSHLYKEDILTGYNNLIDI